jgi:hypothetical protein
VTEKELPKGATIKAIKFLKAWHSAVGGYPTLSAAFTDPVTGDKGIFETKSFPQSTDWRSVHAWIEARQGKANIYFAVNPTIKPMDRKAERTDIARVVALHVDVDIRVGEPQAEGIERIVKTLQAYKVPPSVVISSGGGAQAFWILKEPIEINGQLELAEDAKLYNEQIERDLAGDKCHNIDRIMRLPGTVNLPTKTKLKKGRVASLAGVVSMDGYVL